MSTASSLRETGDAMVKAAKLASISNSPRARRQFQESVAAFVEQAAALVDRLEVDNVALRVRIGELEAGGDRSSAEPEVPLV